MERNYDDAGKLLLRLLVGVLLLLHGVHKIYTGPGGIEAMVSHYGWPADVAYGVYIGEVVGPILVILGLLSRLGAFFIVVNMAIAVLLTFGIHFLSLNNNGGWAIELEAFYGFGAIVIMLLGAGRFSIGGPLN
jgi:putative oxidoreductase